MLFVVQEHVLSEQQSIILTVVRQGIIEVTRTWTHWLIAATHLWSSEEKERQFYSPSMRESFIILTSFDLDEPYQYLFGGKAYDLNHYS